ncbi:MAG TPA: hypothetical protein VNL39_02685 [Xanthobacteraceae bacterium]|nr:hypothetical protein [Xanthobacteraceae bacterium]
MLRMTGAVAFFTMFLICAAAAQGDRGRWERSRGDDADFWERGQLGERIQFRDREDFGEREFRERDFRERDDLRERDFEERRGFGDRLGDRFGSRTPAGEILLLGERRVRFDLEEDVIPVEFGEDWYRNRWFRALHFIVHDNDIEFRRLVITYINGWTETYELGDRLVRRGERLRHDFAQPVSYIKEIRMQYRTDPQGRRTNASVAVYGELERRRVARSEEWVPIDRCKPVPVFGADIDVFDAHAEGRFRAIRLLVQNAPIEIDRVRITYEDRTEADDVIVQAYAWPDRPTRPFGLTLELQRIERIEVSYRSLVHPSDVVRGFRISRPWVCVEGLKLVRESQPPPAPPGPPPAPRTN